MNYSFRKDEWLTKQLGKVVYQLIISEMNAELFFQDLENLKNNHTNVKFFVFSKVSTHALDIWQCLEKTGFKLIDTNIKFELNGNILSEWELQKDIKICFAEKKYQKATGKIARDNFIYSRFHLDPLIKNDLANQIKKNWVENYFLGKRGDKMVLALMDVEPVGFLQLNIKDKDLFIDLIGVDKKVQGKGIASAMIRYADQNIEHSCIKVGTQIGNLPSIKLYQKLGFVLSGSDYVFHYHNR